MLFHFYDSERILALDSGSSTNVRTTCMCNRRKTSTLLPLMIPKEKLYLTPQLIISR